MKKRSLLVCVDQCRDRKAEKNQQTPTKKILIINFNCYDFSMQANCLCVLFLSFSEFFSMIFFPFGVISFQMLSEWLQPPPSPSYLFPTLCLFSSFEVVVERPYSKKVRLVGWLETCYSFMCEFLCVTCFRITQFCTLH